MADDDAYGGLFGAFPYALRASDSWLFRAYVVVAALVSLLLTVLFAVALVGWIAETLGSSALVTFSRAFLVVIWLLVVAPIFAPVLLVARRHRRGTSVAPWYDAALAATGAAFLCSLYVGLLATVPESQQQPVDGPLAPVVRALYDLPQLAGVGPPATVAAAIAVVHRLGRSRASGADRQSEPASGRERT